MSDRRGRSFYVLAGFFALFVLFLYGPIITIGILSFQGGAGLDPGIPCVIFAFLALVQIAVLLAPFMWAGKREQIERPHHRERYREIEPAGRDPGQTGIGG